MTNSGFSKDNMSPFIRVLHRYRRLIAFLLILIILIIGTFFQIRTEEVGVITRFGKYIRTVESGLNFKIPFVEKLTRVPVEGNKSLSLVFVL